MCEVMVMKKGEPAMDTVVYADTRSPFRSSAVAWNKLTEQLYSETRPYV